MWWPIMQSLTEHLRADTALDGVLVNYGVTNPFPEQDFIDVRYGGSPSVAIDDLDEGEARLWLDVMTKLSRDDAETDSQSGAAYAQLHDLVNKVLASVRIWYRSTDALNNVVFKTQVEQINPDGDELRAHEVAGSRIILKFNWRECGD